MNGALLRQEYAKSVWRLALGMEPIDALHGQPAAQPLQADLETSSGWTMPREDAPYRKTVHRGMTSPLISRTNAGGHILLYHRNFDAWVEAREPQRRVVVRIFDRYRRYVPRRLSVPTVREAEADERVTFARRRIAPFLYPGAGYAVASGSTGLRGRVMWDQGGGQPSAPLRWGRIVARPIDSPADVAGRAFSDDRGEFLLLLRPSAIRAAQLTQTVALQVVVSGPTEVPEAQPAQRAADEWWDLPVETIPEAEGDAPPVIRGEAVPAGYATSASRPRQVHFTIGRILTGLDERNFMFEPLSG